MPDNKNSSGFISLDKKDYPEIYPQSDDKEIYPAGNAAEIYPAANRPEIEKAVMYPYEEQTVNAAEITPYAGMENLTFPEGLRNFLFGGENVLWCGTVKRPKGKRDGPPVLFAAVWTGFSIFWTLAASTASVFMALFGVPFIAIGVGLFVGIFKGRAPYCYAVTDQRIISLKGKELKTEYLESVIDARIYQNGLNSADLICRTEYKNGDVSSNGSIEFYGLTLDEAAKVRSVIMTEKKKRSDDNTGSR